MCHHKQVIDTNELAQDYNRYVFQMPPGHKIMSKMNHSRVAVKGLNWRMNNSQDDAQIYVHMHCCPNINTSNLTLITPNLTNLINLSNALHTV